MTQLRRWLVTGASSGIGNAIACAALERGDAVAATSLNASGIDVLERLYPQQALVSSMDVTSDSSIADTTRHVLERFGGIDVLVNCAGIGMLAAVEEASDADFHQLFEVNFFGTLRALRHVLPAMRAQGAGRIINISSVAGRVSDALVAPYSATKFAVEGLSEGLDAEVRGFGIRVTTVEPGAYATNFGQSSRLPEHSLPAYEPARAAAFAAVAGAPAGDPADLAEVILDIADAADPPRRFAAGSDAFRAISSSLDSQQEELRQWQHRSQTCGAGER